MQAASGAALRGLPVNNCSAHVQQLPEMHEIWDALVKQQLALLMLVERAPAACAHGAGSPFSLPYGLHSAAVLGLCWGVTAHMSFLYASQCH